MIVRNEEKNIPYIFNCVRGFVDYYVIADTGSTDNTVQTIKDYTAGWLEGEVHQHAWKDFATNRNQALDLARAAGAKWALIMDADDELVGDKNLQMEDEVSYFIPRKFGNLQWEVPNIIWLQDDWRWLYPIHEVLVSSRFRRKTADNLWMHCDVRPGYRSSDATKIILDIELLKLLVRQNPEDSRSWFYLASSYATIGDTDNAIHAFKKRADLGGWGEEVCVSNFMIARLRNMQNAPFDEVIDRLIKAHDASPGRAEPLHGISFLNRNKSNNNYTSYIFSKMANTRELKADFLFADVNIYNYGALYEFMLAAYYTNHRDEANEAAEKLQKRMHLVLDQERSRVENDLKMVKTIYKPFDYKSSSRAFV